MKRAAMVVALSLLAGACVGGDGSGGDAGRVRFLVQGAPEELQAFREVVEAFGEVEPGIEVDLIEAADPSDLLARLSTSFAGGSPPDIALLNYRSFGQFAARDLLEPLDGYLDGSGAFQEDDFFPSTVEAFRLGGSLYCLPQNLSSLVVFYNEDLFREANVEPPAAGWRWSEMVSAATVLTQDIDGDGLVDRYGVGVDPEIIRLAPFVWSNGGELVDDQADPTRLALDSPEALEAIDAFTSLVDPYGVMPDDVDLESEDIETRFMNGRLAMIMSSRREVPTFRTITGFDWDVAPLPVFSEPATILHSDGYCMTAGSDATDAAWRFMEFALGPEGQRITVRTGRTVPSLIEVANSPAFLDDGEEPESDHVWLDTAEAIRSVPSISTWPEIEDVANQILEVAMFNEGPSAGDPSAVAEQLIEATTAIFARAEG